MTQPIDADNLELALGAAMTMVRHLARTPDQADALLAVFKRDASDYTKDPERALSMLLRRIQDALIFNRWPSC